MRSTWLSAVVGIMFALDGMAANYTVTQITNNTYPDEYVRINARGDVIWSAWVNTTDTGWTIFKHDAATGITAQLSTSNAFFNSHRMNDSGDAAWLGYDGADYEIFMYQATTQTVTQLTQNNVNESAPEISNNGDVSWFEQRGVEIGSFLFRYDALTQSVSPVEFPGATRQGLHTMNAHGDIAWNAEIVTYETQDGVVVAITQSQEILVFDAASRSIRNLTQSASAIDSNQHLLDNGDVVWTAYDEPTGARAIKKYRASDASVIDVTTEFRDVFMVGSLGHIAWYTVSGETNSLYTVFLNDPATGLTSPISAEVLSGSPLLDGVSSRGDVLWRTVGVNAGPNWFTKHYNGVTQTTTTLTATLNFGAFDAYLADNGDAVWPMWDGTDFEVHSFQADTGQILQLSNNAVDDGVAVANVSGALAWHRFYAPNNSEVVIAVKSAAPSLSIDVTTARWSPRTLQAQIKAKFVFDGVPAGTDVIGATFDGATLLSVAFSKFKSSGAGVYTFKNRSTSAKIDFSKRTIEVTKDNVAAGTVDPRNGVDVEIRFGAAVATDHVAK